MTVKRSGPVPGFRRAPEKKYSPPKIRKPVTDSGIGIGMQAARQDKPENMFAWTGVSVRTLAEIPTGCICDWIHHTGRLEIKYFNGLCSIRHAA